MGGGGARGRKEEGEQDTKHTDTSAFSRQERAPRKYVRCYTRVSMCASLSRGERKGNRPGLRKMLTRIPLPQNPPPRSGGFGLGLSLEFGPKAPQGPPQAAQAAQAAAPPPFSLPPPEPPGARSGTDRRARPPGSGRAALGPGRGHLRGTAPEGDQGAARPARSTPPRRPGLRRGGNPRTCELQARAAPPHLSDSRSPSASCCGCRRCSLRRRRRRRRWRPGHDELRTPPPCPPRRELHCGGGGEGRGWRERKRRTR